jgi:hypothetical protein
MLILHRHTNFELYTVFTRIAPTFFAELYPQKHGWGVYMEH